MAVPRWSSVAIVTAFALVLAGCFVDTSNVDGAYEDATLRYHASTISGENREDSHDITIESGTTHMRIALAFDVRGQIDVILKDPAGIQRMATNAEGASDQDEGTWFETSNPARGTWHVETVLDGSGAYTIGVYL